MGRSLDGALGASLSIRGSGPPSVGWQRLAKLAAAAAPLAALCSLGALLRPAIEPPDAIHARLERVELFDLAQRISGNGSREATASLSYDSPRSDAQLTAWYNTLTATQSADDMFFAVESMRFGYAGLSVQQMRRTPFFKGKAIFSILDQGEGEGEAATIVECGEWAVCTRFGDKGAGVESYIEHEWTLEKSYEFITVAEPAAADRARLSGYFHAEELGGWVLLSTIEVRRGSLPWDIQGMRSSVEEWSPSPSGGSRWATFGPSFAQVSGGGGAWMQVLTARFAPRTAGAENDVVVSANMTEDRRSWGLGFSQGLGFAMDEVLVAKALPELPSALVNWNDLVEANLLPGGCPGYTCRGREWIALWREFFGKPNRIPFTITVVVFLIAFVCYSRYAVAVFCKNVALEDNDMSEGVCEEGLLLQKELAKVNT